MDINIVTPYDAYSFGALLQAYALQHTVEEIAGTYNVGIYEYDKPQKSQTGGGISPKKYLHDLAAVISKKEIARGDQLFDEFRSVYFSLNKDKKSKAYIVGSDQVWNPNNYQGKFYLDFVEGTAIKASYAASLGVSNAEEKKLIKIRTAIKNFEFISVRESSALELLGGSFKEKASVNIDPTFLLSQEEWKLIEREPKETPKEDYVLIFFLHLPSNARQLVKEVQRRTGLKVVLIDRTGLNRYIVKHDYVYGDIGPREFIWLIRNASYIVTSSFHGTAFAVIFEKKFLSLANPTTPSRVKNMLDTLGITFDSSVESLLIQNIDYKSVKQRISEEQQSSRQYLSKVIQAIE